VKVKSGEARDLGELLQFHRAIEIVAKMIDDPIDPLDVLTVCPTRAFLFFGLVHAQ
jgi:hypothetical protein